MKIKIHDLYKNTLFFLKNYYFYIIKIILLITLTQIILNHIFFPKHESLLFLNDFSNTDIKDAIKKLSTCQKLILIKILSFASFSNIFCKTLLFGNLLIILNKTYQKTKKEINVKNITHSLILIFPKLFFLIFTISCLIQIGMILKIIPGVLLAVVLCLSPIILISENSSIKKSIHTSIKISLKNIQYIFPIIILWFLTNVNFSIFTPECLENYKLILKFLSNNFNNFLYSLFLIYLFYLYKMIYLKIKENFSSKSHF